ncbi:hypothetical protein AB0H00_01775 [Nocardia sp. NPDC023852]|uniref:hypothetical protein n=1 Tax=Nocardia sp. NPDC023852 TaxID=3154697 RepID=UPI0033EFDA40
MNESGHGRWVAAVYSAVGALIVAGPLLGPGYLLLRDAVSTPRSYPTDSALGLGDAAPRAVPQDALLATLSPVVDGGLIVKVILVVALWAAAYGSAVLARELLRASIGPQLVAATVALWNPYVAERLLQGHWSLLTGYAALPWTVLAAHRIRAGDRVGRGWGALAGSLAAAGLTPTGALLAGCTALILVRPRHLPATLALWVAASAPWLTATLLSGSAAEPSDPAGIAAFAARAEPGLGTLGTLAGLGGIWNSEAVPDSRMTPLAAIGTVLLLVIVALGVRAVATDADEPDLRHVGRTLLLLAAVAILFPALGATTWGMHVLEWLVATVPGAGLLRDTQKYVALAMPAYALCAAAGCALLARRFPADTTLPTTPAPTPKTARTAVTSTVAAVFVALLVLPLFDLAWGVGGAVHAVAYPSSWQRVAELVDGPGNIAALPGGMFRKFRYSGVVPVLDPAPRMLPNDVLQTGKLPVRGRTVAGEGTRAAEVEILLLQGGSASDLARLGVGWVLVEHTTPGPLGASATTLAQLEPRYQDPELALYRVPGVIELRGSSTTHRVLACAAHFLWGAILIAGPLIALGARARSRTKTRG